LECDDPNRIRHLLNSRQSTTFDYTSFGETDLFFIVDTPDNVRAAAGSLIGNAPGTAKITLTALLTPEEVDQATEIAKKTMAAYRPPG